MDQVIISVAAPKGGVGKTTTAVNLSVGLALKEKKTLLIDLDPGGYCSSAFGYNKEKIFGNIFDLYSKNKYINEIIHKTELPYLEIIPFERMDHHKESELINLLADSFCLNDALKSVKNEYDYIFLDCPPSFNNQIFHSLNASDFVIVPVQSSNFSIEAATRMVKFIDTIRETSNPSLQLDGILLTMHENNTRASFEAKKLLFGLYPNQIFKTTIPKNITVSESTFHNKPVLIFDPNASASKAYFSLVDEIIEKHETRSLMLLSGFDNHHFRNDEIKFGKS